MKPKHCAFALGHLNHQLVHNRVSACYRCQTVLGDYREQFMSEMVNSRAAREHRKKLVSGEWPEGCGSCRDFENGGSLSTRLNELQGSSLEKVLEGYDHQTGAISRLRSIELRFGNECNLTCRHCSSVHSSKWEALVSGDPSLLKQLYRDMEAKGSKPKDGYFEDVLENIVPGLEKIMFSGGETLYQKAHYKFLDAIPAEHAAHIQLHYVTNGTINSLGSWDLVSIWRKFSGVMVLVSTDGVGERFEYFRVGANWKQVEKNIRHWRANLIGFRLNCEITCSAYQMFYLPETLDYLYDNQMGDAITASIVQYPPVINPRIIPSETKLRIKADWEHYIQGIADEKKKEAVLRIGQPCIDYMMGSNLDIYDLPGGVLPTWRDFERQARRMDSLFKTSIEKAFPRIAETFSQEAVQGSIQT